MILLRKNLQTKENALFGAMRPNFLFGTCEHPIYIFYTKYICGIEHNESVLLYEKAIGDDGGIIIALREK